MKTNRPEFVRTAKKHLRSANCGGVAATIRYATTFTPGCTVSEMVAAGAQLGFNPVTVRRQYAVARKEDAEVEACTRSLTNKQFIDAVVRTVLGK